MAASTLESSRLRQAICILRDAKKIELIVDFERSEILRLLDKCPMTETLLSEKIGLTKASIGYHLNLLMEAGLIEIVKTEVEEHSIMQKYYAPKAAIFIPDFDHSPEQIKKQLIQSKKEWLRGVLSALRLHVEGNRNRLQIDSDTLEELAIEALRRLTSVSEEYAEVITSDDRELILSRIYQRTLSGLMRDPKWSSYFSSTFKMRHRSARKVQRSR